MRTVPPTLNHPVLSSFLLGRPFGAGVQKVRSKRNLEPLLASSPGPCTTFRDTIKLGLPEHDHGEHKHTEATCLLNIDQHHKSAYRDRLGIKIENGALGG